MGCALLTVMLDRIGVLKSPFAGAVAPVKGVIHEAFDKRFRTPNSPLLAVLLDGDGSLEFLREERLDALGTLRPPSGVPGLPLLELGMVRRVLVATNGLLRCGHQRPPVRSEVSSSNVAPLSA